MVASGVVNGSKAALACQVGDLRKRKQFRKPREKDKEVYITYPREKFSIVS